MTKPPMIAADFIRELIRPYTTSEWVTQPALDEDGKWRERRRVHTVHHKSLLDQLDAVISGTTLSDTDAGPGAFGSRPAARLDALDTLGRIRRESKELGQVLHLPRLPLRERLSRIAGHLTDQPNGKVKSWWVQARIATQWDSPAWKPKGAPCPIEECEQFGSLRVHLADCIATCTSCGTTWDNQFAVENLGRHVAWCTEHDLSKPRHWLMSEEHELVECVECLPVRDAMTERAMLRARLADTRLARGA